MTAAVNRSDLCDLETIQVVAFSLADSRYGLPLPAVERIVRVVEITPLPKAPDIVLGVVNVRGRVVPVVDIRRRFCLPERGIVLTDQLVIARTTRRTVALVVDAVFGVLTYSQRNTVDVRDVLPELRYVESVVKLDGGLIFIHNLDTFLSLDEEVLLDRAVESGC